MAQLFLVVELFISNISQESATLRCITHNELAIIMLSLIGYYYQGYSKCASINDYKKSIFMTLPNPHT